MTGRRTYKGFFKPQNPQKYRGNVNNIVFRSSWELKLMNVLDNNPAVIEWGSEPFHIPYFNPVDRKMHRYFPDFWIRTKLKDGSVETSIVEVKPHVQTEPPKRPKKVSRKFVTEHATYTTNQAKWEAAEEFCKQQGWKFRVATEYDLGIKTRG